MKNGQWELKYFRGCKKSSFGTNGILFVLHACVQLKSS